jgi:hypothetical protein
MPTNQQNAQTASQELLAKAAEVIDNARAQVFFEKLSAFGVVPRDQADADALWTFGMKVLEESPQGSPNYKTVKQASVAAFGELAVIPSGGSYSEEAWRYAEAVAKLPNFREAVSTVMAINNA